MHHCVPTERWKAAKAAMMSVNSALPVNIDKPVNIAPGPLEDASGAPVNTEPVNKRNEYLREYMRKRRAESKAKLS